MIEYDERGEGRQPDFPDAVVLEEQMISGVILKIAAPCNLNCAYCYVYNHEDQSWKSRPKSIPDAVLDSFIRRATSYARRRRSKLSITLHGGEPTLVGPARLDEIARRIREGLGDHLAGLSMQTNGTLIDDEFVEVFERRGINVGVSLDGPADVHDAERVYHNGRGSHADAMRGIEVLQRHGLRPHILSVLNPRLGGAATYRYFREIGVANFDLLLPTRPPALRAGHRPLASAPDRRSSAACCRGRRPAGVGRSSPRR
ncbi:MAG: radical SAM protein, partial [Planctomycetota bacterium]